jgi:ABC-type phosphate transport system permease subunit
VGRIPTANKRNFSTRVEEIAPNVVLMSLAITVVLITAGIVFVLFESGSKFFTGFACGVDDFNPPQDWSQELKDDIESHAIYSEGSLSRRFLPGALLHVQS